MVDLWSLGGLSLRELLRRTARESWQDSVFGQGGRMAFYQFLAVFPSLLVLLALTARAPHLGEFFKRLIQDVSGQVLPSQGAHLVASLIDELSGRAISGIHFVAVCAGALWAACNATWVMLLLWLYVANGAILIGGEMNSEIEKAAQRSSSPAERSGSG